MNKIAHSWSDFYWLTEPRPRYRTGRTKRRYIMPSLSLRENTDCKIVAYIMARLRIFAWTKQMTHDIPRNLATKWMLVLNPMYVHVFYLDRNYLEIELSRNMRKHSGRSKAFRSRIVSLAPISSLYFNVKYSLCLIMISRETNKVSNKIYLLVITIISLYPVPSTE